MEDVPELNVYDISGVRDEWNELDKRSSEFPPEVSMLVKDQNLLDKVKNLLTRYIEVQDAVKSKERQEDDVEEATDEEMGTKFPTIFEVRHPQTFLLLSSHKSFLFNSYLFDNMLQSSFVTANVMHTS